MNNLKANVKDSVRYSAQKYCDPKSMAKSSSVSTCMNSIWFAIITVIDNFDHLNQYPCFYKLNKQSVLTSLKSPTFPQL